MGLGLALRRPEFRARPGLPQTRQAGGQIPGKKSLTLGPIPLRFGRYGQILGCAALPGRAQLGTFQVNLRRFFHVTLKVEGGRLHFQLALDPAAGCGQRPAFHLAVQCHFLSLDPRLSASGKFPACHFQLGGVDQDRRHRGQLQSPGRPLERGWLSRLSLGFSGQLEHGRSVQGKLKVRGLGRSAQIHRQTLYFQQTLHVGPLAPGRNPQRRRLGRPVRAPGRQLHRLAVQLQPHAKGFLRSPMQVDPAGHGSVHVLNAARLQKDSHQLQVGRFQIQFRRPLAGRGVGSADFGR